MVVGFVIALAPSASPPCLYHSGRNRLHTVVDEARIAASSKSRSGESRQRRPLNGLRRAGVEAARKEERRKLDGHARGVRSLHATNWPPRQGTRRSSTASCSQRGQRDTKGFDTTEPSGASADDPVNQHRRAEPLGSAFFMVAPVRPAGGPKIQDICAKTQFLQKGPLRCASGPVLPQKAKRHEFRTAPARHWRLLLARLLIAALDNSMLLVEGPSF